MSPSVPSPVVPLQHRPSQHRPLPLVDPTASAWKHWTPEQMHDHVANFKFPLTDKLTPRQVYDLFEVGTALSAAPGGPGTALTAVPGGPGRQRRPPPDRAALLGGPPFNVMIDWVERSELAGAKVYQSKSAWLRERKLRNGYDRLFNPVYLEYKRLYLRALELANLTPGPGNEAEAHATADKAFREAWHASTGAGQKLNLTKYATTKLRTKRG